MINKTTIKKKKNTSGEVYLKDVSFETVNRSFVV